MTDFWQNLTARERALVSTAGLLALLVLAYFALFRPLAAYQAESTQALARAQATLGRIEAGAAEVMAARKGGNGAASAPATSLRVAVAQTARDSGVAITRLQPGTDGALTVWVDAVPSPQFFQWLERMGAEHGLSPAKVMAQKTAASGQLRVQLDFGGGQ